MRNPTTAILICVLILTVYIASTLALISTTFDANTIRSTTIDLPSLFNADEAEENDNIVNAVSYAQFLGSNTVIAQGFIQVDDTPTSELLFPNTMIDANPVNQQRLVKKLVDFAHQKDLRVAIVLPILSYLPANTSTTDYTLIESTDNQHPTGFDVCSIVGSKCRLSPFDPHTGEMLAQVLNSLLVDVPSLDMIIFTQEGLSEKEDCSPPALDAYFNQLDLTLNCTTLQMASPDILLSLGHLKARQISNIVKYAVEDVRSFYGNFLVGRYVYTSPFTDNTSVQYLAQDCESIFVDVDVIFPLALPYFEKETPFGDNTITQFDGYFKQVYDAFVRCDPTLLRIVPTLQTIDWSYEGEIIIVPEPPAEKSEILAVSPFSRPIDPAEVYHWADYLLNRLGFVHINILDVNAFEKNLSIGITSDQEWRKLLLSENSKCINESSFCSDNTCIATPLISFSANCRSQVCFEQPSSPWLTANCLFHSDRCSTFAKRYGCPEDPCVTNPKSSGCTRMFISQINNEDVVLTDGAPRALYPGSSSITLEWDARLLIGAPSPFEGAFLSKMTLYLEYLSLGMKPTTVIIESQPLFDIMHGSFNFIIPSSTLAGSDVSFRLRYESPGGKYDIVTNTPQLFLSPTCFAATSFQIKDNMFTPTGSDQCQNGTTCSMLTGMCACEALWPTYTAVDFNDRCTRRSASEFITCHNGGKVGRGVDGKGIWQCDCVNGFTGKYCDSSPDCFKALVCYNQGFVAKDPVTKQCASQCTCQANWINNVCDTCSFRCLNGGRQNKGCTSCACAQGYSGTNCQCRQISFSMTLTSVPSAILDAYDSSSATADVFILNWFATQLSANVIQSSATSSPITSNNLSITTMTIDTTLESKLLKVAGYVIDNCQELANNNNFASIRDAWNTFTDYIKTNPLDIDGTPYTPVDVKTTSLDDQCDELYSNSADKPDCARQTLVEREDGIGGPSEDNFGIYATPSSIFFTTMAIIMLLLILQ